jgi:hypothetical protein
VIDVRRVKISEEERPVCGVVVGVKRVGGSVVLVDMWLDMGEEVAVEERVVLVRGGGVMNSQPWFCVWKSAVCVPLGGVILARLDCILAIIAII